MMQEMPTFSLVPLHFVNEDFELKTQCLETVYFKMMKTLHLDNGERCWLFL